MQGFALMLKAMGVDPAELMKVKDDVELALNTINSNFDTINKKLDTITKYLVEKTDDFVPGEFLEENNIIDTRTPDTGGQAANELAETEDEQAERLNRENAEREVAEATGQQPVKSSSKKK